LTWHAASNNARAIGNSGMLRMNRDPFAVGAKQQA